MTSAPGEERPDAPEPENAPAHGAEVAAAATEHSPPGVALLWGDRQRPTRGPRPGLSIERIVDEAIAIADAEGIAALTMPGLAKRLGAGTMSLYRYIPGKIELISLMLDAAIGPAPDITATDTAECNPVWRTRISVWARAMRLVFLRHRWMLDLVTLPRTMGPQELTWLETGLRSLAEVPLPPMTRFDLVLLVSGFVRVNAVEQTNEEKAADWGPTFSPGMLQEYGREQDFPLLLEVMAAFPFADPPADGEYHRFQFNLSRVLDGIEIYVDSAAS